MILEAGARRSEVVESTTASALRALIVTLIIFGAPCKTNQKSS